MSVVINYIIGDIINTVRANYIVLHWQLTPIFPFKEVDSIARHQHFKITKHVNAVILYMIILYNVENEPYLVFSPWSSWISLDWSRFPAVDKLYKYRFKLRSLEIIIMLSALEFMST